MTKHIHGGNIYAYETCLDFSANCNPLGTPPSVIRAVTSVLPAISSYPQVGYAPLREALAAYEDVPSENIICGNGAAELIFTLCRAWNPRRALVTAPTFAEYEQALASVNCEIEHYDLTEASGFAIDEKILPALHEDLDMVFLCNPNNPTGVLINPQLLHKILQQCQKNGILLVVDECFLDFVKSPALHTLKPYLSKYGNLFLLKAFTKRYAMAGIRLGYGLTGNQKLLEKMEAVTQPWNISTLAQAAGIAALKEKEYVEKGRQLVFKEAAYLTEHMKQLGLKVYPSQANYIFFYGPENLFEACVEKNILIRDCSNYPGLTKGYWRIAVKKHEDNEKLLKVLEEVIQHG